MTFHAVSGSRARVCAAIVFTTLVGLPGTAGAEAPAEAARRIVAHPRYQRAFPSNEPVTRPPPERPAPPLGARPWRPPPPPSGSATSGLVEGLGLVLAAVAAGAAGIAGWRALRRWRRRTAGAPDSETPATTSQLRGPDLAGADAALLAARRLEAEGRWEEAILVLWHAALAEVGGEAAGRGAHLTGRELLTALKVDGRLEDDRARAGLTELLKAMETVRFAARAVASEDVQRCVAAFSRVREAAGAWT
jgi:hypothetical protein